MEDAHYKRIQGKIQLTSKRQNRLGPNFVWDLTYDPKPQNYKNLCLKVFDFC